MGISGKRNLIFNKYVSAGIDSGIGRAIECDGMRAIGITAISIAGCIFRAIGITAISIAGCIFLESTEVDIVCVAAISIAGCIGGGHCLYSRDFNRRVYL